MTRRRARLWRVRRFNRAGEVKAVRVYHQRDAALERARRFLLVPGTSRVTVESAHATFTAAAEFEPLPTQELPPCLD